MDQRRSVFALSVDGEAVQMELWSTSSRTVLGFYLATGWLAPSLFEHEGSLTPRLHSGTLLLPYFSL